MISDTTDPDVTAACAKSTKEIQSLEWHGKACLPDRFVDEVMDQFVHTPTSTGNISFISAPFQAEPCVAKLAINPGESFSFR